MFPYHLQMVAAILTMQPASNKKNILKKISLPIYREAFLLSRFTSYSMKATSYSMGTTSYSMEPHFGL